jgi:hypothetical protein
MESGNRTHLHRIRGHGRRYWMVRGRGHNRENIAFLVKSWRQLKPRGGDMRRQHGDKAGSP